MDVNENHFIEILKGRYDNLPKERSKIVRIFLSSTFTDTHEERDYLIEKVYPKLKTYCKINYGLDFQVLDMRWGITSESTINHLNTTVCLNEVKNCQKYSIGPNFVTLLSHKYGNRDVPSRIQADEFQILKEELEFNKVDLSFKFKNDDCDLDIPNILEYSYKLDENEIPFRYKLLSLRTIITGYEHNKRNFKKAWSTLEGKLGNILRSAAQSCHNKEKISYEQYEKYFVSITEKEIFNGILSANNTTNNCLAFYREIEDIEEHVSTTNRKLFKRFIDLDEHGNIDGNSRTLLNQLKYKKLKKCLPDANQHTFKVKWNENGGVTRATHPEYMEQFGSSFYNSVKELIDRNASQAYFLDNLNIKDRQLFQEVLDHASFCNECVEKFHGRSDLIEQMKSYILSEERRPFVLHGESGCGKTSVIAKVSHDLLNFVPNPQDYLVILRFMGTTPETSNIFSTYRSVLNQLSRLLNIKLIESKVSSKKDLRDYFLSHLLYISENFREKLIVIFLDSIDQLSSDDYNTDWMVFELPSNIKMVYSTLPDHGGILESIRRVPRMVDSCFLKIESLNKAIVKTILEDWLNKQKHCLTENQWKILEKLFDRAKMFPLYVKLIFDIIVKWTSFYEPGEEISRLLDIDKCIEYLFEQLEKDHGKVLFSRSMVYMSTFKNGISESELEDILSIDDDVLFEIFEYHAPPIRRFPVVLWSRIKHDLNEYMVEKEANDTRVIYWYHRRFIEVANSVYVNTLKDERDTVFQNVIDFFNETWKHTPKPYKYTKHVAAKKNLDSDESEATRNTSIQSTVFVSSDGVVRYNKRKITELPNFISQLTSNLAVPLSCDHIYFNYEFLHGLFVVLSYSGVFEYIREINSNTNYATSVETREGMKNFTYLNFIFLKCGISIGDYPDSTSVQIIAQSLSVYGILKYFTKLIDESDASAAKDCALTVPYQFLQPPGLGVLLTLEKHIKPITYCIVGGSDVSLVFSLSDKIHVFSMDTIHGIGDIELPKLDSKDEYKILRVITFDSMEDCQKLSLLKGYFTVISNYTLVSISFDNTIYFKKSFDNIIENIYQITKSHILVFFRDCNYFEIYNCQSGKLIETKFFKSKIKFLACNANEDLVNVSYEMNEVCIIVAMESGLIDIYSISEDVILLSRVDEKDQNENTIHLVLKKQIPPAGIECVGCRILKDLDKETLDFDCILVSYKDGSLIIYDMSEENVLIKPKLNELTEEGTQITLKLLEGSSKMLLALLLGSNNCLYFTNFEDSKFYKIEGYYESGRFIDSDYIIGIYKGMIDIFIVKDVEIKDGEYELRTTKISQIDAHYGDITRLFYKDRLFLSTSTDTTLKIFDFNSCKLFDEFGIKFDRTKYHIEYLSSISSNAFLSCSLQNSEISVWDAMTGKIMLSLDQKVGKIHQMVKSKDIFCFVASMNQQENEFLFQALTNIVDEQCNQSPFNYEVKISNCNDVHLWCTNDKYLVLSEVKDQLNPLMIHIIVFNKLNAQWTHNTIIDICTQANIDATNKNLRDSFAASHLNSNLVFFNQEEIVYVNFDKTIKTVKKKLPNKLKSNYFINGRDSLKQISKTDDFVALNNLNQLVYIEYNSSSSKITLYVSEGLSANFIKIEANQQIICAYDEKSENLFVYEREKCKKDQFKKPLFKAEVKNELLSKLCISDNNEYILTVELPKIVSLYRINDGKRIAHVPMYSKISSIAMSDNYVAMAMQDRRIVTLLITDPLKPDNDKLIKALPSRNINNIRKDDKTKVESQLKFLNNIFDNSDSEDNTDIFDSEGEEDEKEDNSDDGEAANWKKTKTFKKLKKHIKAIPPIDSIKIKFNFAEFKGKKNFLLDLNNTHKFIDEKQLSILTRMKKPAKNPLLAQTTIDLGFNDYKKKETLTEDYKKELIDGLVKSNEQKLKFTNTGKNVTITNAHTANSRMCSVS